MPEPLPNVRLQLANTPENVVLVREMLSGVAEALGVGESDLNDIRTAVTEACNNVVLHAYEGNPGPMEIDVHLASQAVRVLVRDRGSGIQALPENDEDGSPAGIGLHVIQTLAHGVEFEEVTGGGTEVCMEFALPTLIALEPRSDEQELATVASAQTSSTTLLSIAPIALARTVLPRLVSALAARAHFSTDRISDAQLLADSLVAHAHGALSGDQLSLGVDVEPREIELRIAPLTAGRAHRLICDSELDGLGRVIEKLTDRRHVATVGPYETLTLGLIDSR
jgi:anti-sigma regulatory factor (Ser/Thr protein kinase)